VLGTDRSSSSSSAHRTATSKTAEDELQRPVDREPRTCLAFDSSRGKAVALDRRGKRQDSRGHGGPLLTTRNWAGGARIVRAVGGEHRASGAASLRSGERPPSHGVYWT
jgi:hypothetical protein